jgi:hypothetical protein
MLSDPYPATEEYMRAWCRRVDFRAALPYLSGGGDPEFVAYLGHIAREEATTSGTRPGMELPAVSATS